MIKIVKKNNNINKISKKYISIEDCKNLVLNYMESNIDFI